MTNFDSTTHDLDQVSEDASEIERLISRRYFLKGSAGLFGSAAMLGGMSALSSSVAQAPIMAIAMPPCSWSPDRKTMFVGVQHPGEKGNSHWPNGGNSVPRSAVIAIRREDGGLIG